MDKGLAWLLSLVMTAAAVSTMVEAGCYRKGYKRPVYAEDDPMLYHNHEPLPTLSKHELAKRFDWCDLDGKNWCAPSWNQHIPQYCGACWLHGTLSAVQDRIKIQKGGKGEDVMLGRQTLLNCAPFHGYSQGCDGGDPIDVYRYMKEFGLPDESCMPYNATDYTKYKDLNVTECPDYAKCMNCMPINDVNTCWTVPTPIMYTLKSYGKLPKGEEAMMTEIFKRGPITCGIACPDDFVYSYRGGIYKDVLKDKDVDHDVEVVGWGEEDGVQYWHVRNSWGTYWGELGFFRIERGVNALQIEAGDCWYAIPDYKMEGKVLQGKLQGSMYGLIDPKNSSDLVSSVATSA